MIDIQLSKLDQIDPYYKGARRGCDLLLQLKECSDDVFVASLIIEAGARFSQLEIILGRVKTSIDAQNRCENKWSDVKKKHTASSRVIDDTFEQNILNQIQTAQDLAILDAETFYAIGFRILDISRAINKRLFGSQPEKPNEPSGVRDVRNKLIYFILSATTRCR